tara:strand:+ start:3171 stop:3389 length:219 start_codon:yes stop_codon:yes gene_type:complete
MAYKNQIQTIWKREEDDSLTLQMPKIINSDISFQLMFGMAEDPKEEKNKIRKHHNKFTLNQYTEKHIKIWFY